ncbi:LamG-like jellyroll fold domain-containing protein [Pyxidicoccus caerfyrddinensis]|uniref:LamG-like jellyroll fold domain-containing protein n=1 Tax=Pyxidicoccus caerfyrddinensis TaxID=2709663 RepID=UPI0013DA4957|nr:LamG-like jellyroll fold domain-containing protein [Pyxidicoccus caerfyrddinensis]
MSFAHLLQQFDAIGPMGPRAPITLDQAFTGSAEVTAMFRSVFGTEALTLDTVTAQTSRSEDHLQLVGTTSVFGMPDVQVTFLARELEGELLATLDILLPGGFSFSSVFPLLPEQVSAEVDELTGDKVTEPHFLTRLSLGTGRLLFSNRAWLDEKRGLQLVPGLNFSGELYFMGLLFPARYLLRDDSPVQLSGPLKEFRPTASPMEFLGVRLSAPLEFGFDSLGPLTLKQARLFLKAGFHAHHLDPVVSATQDPGVYVLIDAELGGRPAQLVGAYEVLDIPTTVDIHGRFTDFGISGFASLSQTVGVEGFEQTLPEDFPTDTGLSITELGVSFNIVTYAVSRLILGVGARVEWDIVPDVMTLKEVGLTFTISEPFSSARRITPTLTGLLAFKKFSLAAFAEYPTWRFGAGLPSGETLPLGDVIESFLPGETELPPLTIQQLLLQASPREKKVYLSATLQDLLSIPVGATAFEVAGFNLVVDYDKVRGGAKALVSARLRMADTDVILSGEVHQGLVLSGSLQGFALKKFWSLVTGGEALPEEVPDIVFDTLAFRVDTKTRAFSVLGNAVVDWDPLTKEGSLRTAVEFSLTRDVSGSPGATVSAFRASLSLQGEGPVPVAEGLSLGRFNLLFSYQTGTSWQLSGGVSANLFDTVLALQAGYESIQGIQKLMLRATASPELTLIDLQGVGSYSFKQFDLLLDRRSLEGGKKKTYFDLRLASTLEIDSLFKLGGYLGISATAEGRAALVFKPNPGSTSFQLDFPTGEGLGFRGELFEVGVVKESASAGWSFTGTTLLGFTGISGGLAQMLPTKVTAKLVAGRSAASLSAVNVSGPIDFALPRANGKDLGKVVIQLTELGISIKPQLGLVLEAGLGLPAELNTYLGAQLFRVYQPGNPLTLARTRFTISGTGVAMQVLSSPFTGANAVVVNNEAWYDVDFGKYGAIRFKMPTFVYDGITQYFEAGGGVKVTRPLALPLAPLKLFLEACGGKGMADIFPDAIPIEALDLVDDNNDLKIDALVTFLKKAGGVPNEIVSALKTSGKVLNRFPDGFKQYLQLEVPEELEFKFGFSPTGRISLGLLAPKTPVRVLFPSVVQSYVPMPGLVGIEVRKFSVGTLMSGSLFYGEVDALIDQFDLPSLAVSLMLPRSDSFPLPTSDQLQRRIILDDVFCIIPVSQGLPIPLPVFYDELGFQYLGIEGLGLQAHVGFPKPKLDGAAAMAVFQAFNQFFNDRKALLDPNTPPGGVDLAFKFHDEFLQAPEYLGNGLLGTKGKTVTVGAWKYIASLMNFGKTFSINDCIGSIPIENRVGSAEYRFAFMKFDADWLLTTPAEFRKGGFQRLKLTESDRDDFMTVLPSVASTSGQGQTGNEEGLVAFVRGEADLKFMRMEAALGLAASGAMGFNTGFKLDGRIGVTELELSGAIMVNAPLATDVPAAPVLQAATPAPQPAPAPLALSFNGKDTRIEIPASDSLVLPEYTVELWMKTARDQSSEWADVIGVDTRKSGLWRNNFLAVNANSGFYHHRFTDAGGGNAGAPNTANGTVTFGQWQHVAITNDGVTAKTYVDGKELASGPVNGALVLFKDTLWVSKVSNWGLPWKGELAEIRIWKRARSGTELAGTLSERIDAGTQDLVSLYRFDTDTGSRAVDLCGRNHGTIANGRFVPSELLSLRGLVFDGKDDYVEVPDSESLRLGTYTVEVWCKPKPNPQDWAGLFGKRGRNYAVYLNRAGFIHHRFHTPNSVSDGAPDSAPGLVAWNQWNHVAITNDGTVARTFLNGVKVAEGPVRGNLIIDKERVSFGRTADGENNAYFAGEMSEVRLWSSVRSPEELTANMRRRLSGAEAGLVSLWRFSEATGNTLVDACKRNPGRIEMQLTAEPAKLRHDGLILNGTSDSALIAQTDKFRTDQYTLEAWVRPDKDPAGSWQCIWGGSGKAPKLYVSNNGIVSHRYTARVSPTEERACVLNTAVNALRFGEWNHLAVTNDGTTCTVFVNGVQVAQEKMPGKLVSEAASVNVGSSGDANAQAWFRGGIDDLRYWSVARTAAQISDDMNLFLTGKEPGLVAYYNMDHTAGTQLVDLGPNALHGVVGGGTWALAASPATQGRAAIQLRGHTQMTVSGHTAMRGDLKLVDDQFWFSGQLDLFPKDWPLKVTGNVEGMVSRQRFYVQGETRNQLFGLTLSQSRVYLSNDQLRLEGRWLGSYMLLDVSWDKGEPSFKGSVGFKASAKVDFGLVRIGGAKVADNVGISVDLLLDVSVLISKKGFSGDLTARFKVNGKGFDVRFSFDVPPADFEQLVNWVKQRIVDAPEKYLEHLFSDAVTWLRNVGSGAISFAKDSGEAIGKALSSAYKASKEEAAKLMKGANYAADQVGTALSKGYKATAQEAAAVLKGADYAVDQVGNALKSAYSTSAEEAAKLLKGAGYAADQVGNALKSAYGTSVEEVTRWLKGAGYAVDQVGNALKSAYGTSAEAAAKLLRGAGYAADQVGNALKSAYGTSAEAAAKLLNGAGYAADQVGNALKSAYGTSAEEAAKLLKGAGYAVDQVGGALKSAYGTSANEAARLLKNAGYAADQVGNALKSAYGTSAEEAAKLLQGVGYAADQVGNALKVGWNTSADATSKALKAAGYGVNEVGNYLKSGYNLGADALSGALKGAGYATDEINKLFKNLGGEFSKAASKLDPTKW